MDMDNKSGKMGLSMTDSGKEIKPMAKELSFMLMAIFMKGSG
jgi:hypothetical protein